MGTDDGVISFLPNLLPVTVPPSHTAFVGAEQLFLAPSRLDHGSATVAAGFAAMDLRVAADVGSDGIDRDTQQTGNFRCGFPLQAHLIDSFDFLLFHG